MSNKIKGNILEDLVAMMHQVPGVRVEKRRKLPVLRSKTKRKREIDVLITSSVAGYKVQIALGCKNEATALKTSTVDNFVGILNDVGIPIQQGILVSANGYTRDAQDAADAHGFETTPSRPSLQACANISRPSISKLSLNWTSVPSTIFRSSAFLWISGSFRRSRPFR